MITPILCTTNEISAYEWVLILGKVLDSNLTIERKDQLVKELTEIKKAQDRSHQAFQSGI